MNPILSFMVLQLFIFLNDNDWQFIAGLISIQILNKLPEKPFHIRLDDPLLCFQHQLRQAIQIRQLWVENYKGGYSKTWSYHFLSSERMFHVRWSRLRREFCCSLSAQASCLAPRWTQLYILGNIYELSIIPYQNVEWNHCRKMYWKHLRSYSLFTKIHNLM